MPEDELNQNHNPEGEETESLRARIAELEDSIAEKESQSENHATRLGEAEAMIVELKRMLADKERELADLKQTLAGADETLVEVRNSLAEAVASYRALVAEANPDIPDELITGDSIATVAQSLASARNLVSSVKKGLEAEIARTRVPAGAPQRTPPDLSALSPREKIQIAIGGNK